MAIMSFLDSSQCLAKSYRATPLFFLSEKEFVNIKKTLNLSSYQEEQINTIMRNKLETQQTLIKKNNKMVGIIDAYDAIQNKQDYWDKETMQTASGLSQKQIDQIGKDLEKIKDLIESQVHLIDDLKIKAILDNTQITQWYQYKFYHYAEWLFSETKNISLNKNALKQKVSNVINDMLRDHSIIDQKIVDEVFLSMYSELKQDK
jgi:hypothetical protein